MRILITGNNGYIGTVMTRMALSEQYEVVGLDNDLFEGSVFGDESVTGGISQISYLRKDLREVNISDLTWQRTLWTSKQHWPSLSTP